MLFQSVFRKRMLDGSSELRNNIFTIFYLFLPPSPACINSLADNMSFESWCYTLQGLVLFVIYNIKSRRLMFLSEER